MELELRQDYISCWENAYRTDLNLEETTEMIVPDACPDILQVLDGEGKLLLGRKDAQDGKAEFSGVIKVCILYQPEGEGKLCTMEAKLPFSCSVDSPAIHRRSKLMVTPTVQKVDIHLLNPRKVLIRVLYCLELRCHTAQSLPICPCVENGEAYGIQEKVEEYQSYLPVAAVEKQFNYSDILALPAGRPDLVELLRTRAECICNEAKVIGSKLVFKGEALLDILYRSRDEELHTAAFHLPFSQIMECSDAGEESVPQVEVIYTDLSCKPMEDDGRNLSVELELLAQGVLSRTESSPILTDLYSTGYEVSPLAKEYPTCRKMDQGAAPESVREVLETGMPVKNVLDVQVRPIQLTTETQNGNLTQNAEVEVFVLYASEEGGIGSLHRRFIVVHQIPVSDKWEYQCGFTISRPGMATPAGAGLEVAFTVEFTWVAMELGSVRGIEGAGLEEKPKGENQLAPSVIIRSVRPGEGLWEIAKAYGTTKAEIAEANALPTTELYPGQMLIIPKVQDCVR